LPPRPSSRLGCKRDRHQVVELVADSSKPRLGDIVHEREVFESGGEGPAQVDATTVSIPPESESTLLAVST
jgi:hypothetical protein